jgi:hypothetical protein
VILSPRRLDEDHRKNVVKKATKKYRKSGQKFAQGEKGSILFSFNF